MRVVFSQDSVHQWTVRFFIRASKNSIHQWTVPVILTGSEALSINGVCMFFGRSFLKFNPSVDWHVWFLARIQSISGLNKWFFHNPSVDCTTIFANVQICNPLMDCASPFFLSNQGKNTPLNANDVNLFLPLFSHFFLHLKCHQLPNF